MMVPNMKTSDQLTNDLLKDLKKINAVMATELIQLVENSCRLVRGTDVPDACKSQHRILKKEVIALAEKWSGSCRTLREHNLDHE